MGVVVDHQRRGVVAVAQAAHRQQGEAAVGGGLAEADAELLLDLSDDRLMAADVADHAVADADDVTADRLAEDLAIEGGHAFDVARRDTEDLADRRDGAVRHPAALLLDDLQRFDGRRTGVLVVVHFMLDGRAFGFAEGETVSLDNGAHDQRSTSAITKSMLPR
ncbi:hypothetical protein D9M71_576600 [compost metagenome]